MAENSEENYSAVEEEGALQIKEIPKTKKRGRKRKTEPTTFKKAPQAPKRFKSSYICFSIDKQKEIKKELGPGAKVTQIAKKVSAAWKILVPEEREIWDKAAKKDKERFMAEKAVYKGPWQVPSKRSKKDPSAPKRPMSAFLYYSQKMRPIVKSKNSHLKNTEVSKALGELWKSSSDEEREPYIKREAEERAVYKVAIAAWRENHEKEEEVKRLEQEESMRQQIENQRNPPQFQPSYVYNPHQDPMYMGNQQNPHTIMPDQYGAPTTSFPPAYSEFMDNPPPNMYNNAGYPNMMNQPGYNYQNHQMPHSQQGGMPGGIGNDMAYNNYLPAQQHSNYSAQPESQGYPYNGGYHAAHVASRAQAPSPQMMLGPLPVARSSGAKGGASGGNTWNPNY